MPTAASRRCEPRPPGLSDRALSKGGIGNSHDQGPALSVPKAQIAVALMVLLSAASRADNFPDRSWIAARLQIAEVTARDHVQRILHKFQVSDRAAAAALAVAPQSWLPDTSQP